MFTAALFIIARIWRQPKGPSMNEKNVIHTHTHTHTHTGILFSHEKEGNPAICDNMDGP